MPGFVARLGELAAKGVDTVACTAVNDIFVLTNWAKDTGALGKVLMLADGSAEFANKIGLDVDLRGLGVRSKRYAMLVEDGSREGAQRRGRAAAARQVERRDPVLDDRLFDLSVTRFCQPSSGRAAPAEPRFRNGFMPSRASSSARSFSVCPACPAPMEAHLVPFPQGVEALPQLGVLDRLLVGGLPAVLLPAVDPGRDPVAQILAVGMESTTLGRFSASSAEMAASSSMRLLVVSGSPPWSSLRCSPEIRIAPQPPGPGFRSRRRRCRR